MRTIWMPFILGLALAGLGSRLGAETIRLRSGQILLGTVEGEPDERGFAFRRVEDGGLLEIEWRHLMPGEVRRLKEKFDLLERTDEEILVKAKRILLRPPGLPPQLFTGIEVGRAPGTIILRARGVETPLKTEMIRDPIETVEVPALEVYTPEEFYQLQLQEIQPGEDPGRNERLAANLKAAGDFERAREHYRKVLELDPNYRNKGAVERSLRQLDAAIANKDVAELMKKVRQAQSVRDYRTAMALAAQLDERAAQMPKELKNLWNARKEKLLKDRRSHLAGRVAALVYERVRRYAAAKAQERDAAPTEVGQYAEKEMAPEVLGSVAVTLELALEEVQALWQDREALRRAHDQAATYGDGTFILPKEKAHAGTNLEGKSGQKKPGQSGEREEMERRVREFLRQQLQRRQGSQGRGGAQGEPEEKTPEDWWRGATLGERQGWVMAYFAEFGSLMKVRRVLAMPCPNCGGTGTITAKNATTGDEEKQKCPVCHGLQIRRSVTYY